MGGATPRWADLLALARQAEHVGFDSLWLIDHFLYRFPNDPENRGLWECWSLLSALAAATKRVELGTLVLGAGFRNPALTAKMADTVEEISGGRLILGLGAGYHELEYRAFGYPFDHRVGRFAEALQIIHGLLRDGAIDFEGRYHSARECELRPRAPRPNGPPIMIGSVGERMLRLTARHADLWNAYFDDTGNRSDGIPSLRAKVDAACVAEGRDPTTLARTASVQIVYPTGDVIGSPWPVPPLTGSPAELAAELRRYAREGVSHVQLSLEPMTPASIEAFAPVLELLTSPPDPLSD
jgi:alkanesulfonate monooxygenase SsuD/methylene tetrahydromethanopterin reductase-like flavin-dependent oxidoreductase (luciferase family)